jgi:hypothetical protein
VSVTPPDQPAGEVRVTEYVRRALRRWYVIVFAVVVAVMLVFLHGVSGATNQSTASASVYLGQPFSPGGSALLNSTPLSNPTIPIEFVTSPRQLAAAAAKARVAPAHLRSHVSVLATGAGTGKAATNGSPTISIAVEGPWSRLQVQTIANSLAQSLIDFANRYTTQKTKLISGRILQEKAQLAAFAEVERRARDNLKTIDSSSAAPLTKVAAESPFVTSLSAAADQIGTLTTNLTNDQLTLVAAKSIESAQFITHAVGRKVSAATRRNSLIIAAIVGLIVGTGLALVWESLRMRPRRERA